MIDDDAPTPRPWVPTLEAPPPPVGGRSWQPVAGPADRVSFFAEQARRRRSAWWLGVVSTLAVVLAGLPLSLVATPLVFLAIILLTRAISVVVPLSPAVPALYQSVAMSIGSIMDAVEMSDKATPPPAMLGAAAVGVAWLLVPGILAMLAFWIVLRRLFSGAGVGALAIGLGACEPRPADFEEHQLVNVVEEMAIAAGLPAPRVMLFDGQIANAAVVGSSPADAVVIVSRRLLDEMDRDETQGILAHLIASIGNGDLGVALMMVTVFRTFGLVNTLLDAPVSSSARSTLGQLIAVAFFGRGKRDDAERAAHVAELLGSRVEMMEMEDVDQVLGDEAEKARAPGGLTGLLTKIRVYAFFPIWAAAGMAKTAMMLMVFGLLSPMLAWTWRTRRYLADATAVQLTRNPDGIARGLQALLTRGGGIRGGEWADHLFVVGGGRERHAAELEELGRELRARVEQETAGKTGAARTTAALGTMFSPEQARAFAAKADALNQGDRPSSRQSQIGGGFGWISPHPSLRSRLKRLQALGAHLDADAFKRSLTPAQLGLMVLVLGPLGLLIAALLSVALVLATGLVVVFMMIPMGLIYFLFEWLF